jgi:hypothetical protein
MFCRTVLLVDGRGVPDSSYRDLNPRVRYWLNSSNKMCVCEATNSTILSCLTAGLLLMHSKEVQGGVIFKLIWNTAASQAGAKR